jgi:hypothetical protein
VRRLLEKDGFCANQNQEVSAKEATDSEATVKPKVGIQQVKPHWQLGS